MSKKNKSRNLLTCRGGWDYVRFTRRSKKIISERVTGDHWIGTTSDGDILIVPLHREIGKGLRCKLIKTILALGLAGLIIILIYVQIGGLMI